MVLKPIIGSLNHINPVGPKRPKEPEQEDDDLNTTDDRKSCQKSHGASNQAQLCVVLDLFVPLNVVKGCRVKIDLDELNCGFWNFFS